MHKRSSDLPSRRTRAHRLNRCRRAPIGTVLAGLHYLATEVTAKAVHRTHTAPPGLSASSGLQLGHRPNEPAARWPLALPDGPAGVEELLLDAEKNSALVLRDIATVPRVSSFCSPVIVIKPPAGSCIFEEEVFRPVLVMSSYDWIEVVLAATRDCSHMRANYVFGVGPLLAQSFADALDVGATTPNTPQIPFGGLKRSDVCYECGQSKREVLQSPQAATVTQR
jgi:succinate-semialdehyde dehydrogenase/glutarate-semialdehyde dehydrogenase